MSNEIQIFKSEDLLSVMEQNKSLTERALNAMDGKIKTLPVISTELTIEQGNQIESEVNELRVRGNDAIKVNKDRRMVFTRRMDEVKALFTAQEKDIQSKVDVFSNWSNSWNAEKLRREREEQKEKEAELAKATARIDFKTAVAKAGVTSLFSIISNTIERMVAKFNESTVDNLKQYVDDLKKYTPVLPKTFSPNAPAPSVLSNEEVQEINSEVREEYLFSWENEYAEAVTKERDRLIESLPGRLKELKDIAADAAKAKEAEERMKKEQEEREAEMKAKQDANAESITQEANMDKMDAVMDVTASSDDKKVSSGTQVSLKYNPANHKEMLKIIQYWVENAMPLMTIEELHKKLSFMRTFANAELKKGEQIDGVTTIEDVRTRANRK